MQHISFVFGGFHCVVLTQVMFKLLRICLIYSLFHSLGLSVSVFGHMSLMDKVEIWRFSS